MRSILPAGLLLAACAALGESEATAPAPSPAVFDDHGELERPRGYRRWVFTGAPLTPNDMNGGKAVFPEFHAVYVDPRAYDRYKASGAFPDGTVVVKELVSVGGKAESSGKGYFMGEFLGLEAMVKSAERFPDEPGNWGFFRFTDDAGGPVRARAAVLPTSSCAACHRALAADDLVFTQVHPVLRAAKGYGAGEPEDG